MKIGIYSPYLDTLGGGERYMLTIADCLGQAHRVDIFWNDGSILGKAQERLHLTLANVFVVPNIFSQKSTVKKAFESSKYDCIFMLSDGSIPVSFAKKIILHFQQPFQNVGGKRLLNRIKFRNISIVICNSNFTKKLIDQEYSVNSLVVYPPVDTAQFIKTNQKKEKIILSVGRFHPVKKHEVLIEAFRKIADKGWKLVLAGGLLDKDTDYFNEIAAKTGSKNIILKPNVSFEELKQLYLSAKFYWHGTGFGENESEHPERMEHFGIAPVEAMAAGCIPLLFKGGGLIEILEDYEEFLWTNETELVEKTSYYMTNNSATKALQNKLLQRSKLFDQSTFCSRVKDLLLLDP